MPKSAQHSLPFVPTEVGTQGLSTRRQVWAPLPWGECCSACIHIFDCQRACCDEISCKESKKYRPLFRLWARGSPSFSLFFRPLKARGSARRQGAAWIAPGWNGSGREASRPAPCGAPTRHLGLYAFDRGRTGPAPSGRRGCPSTARGRGCVSHRSQVPLPFPANRTPPEGAPRRVDRDMSRVAKISPYVKSRFRY